MYEVELFLGFPIDSSFATALSSIDPKIISIFIRNDRDYLQEITYQNNRYIGKFAGKLNDLSGLELLNSNIYSILKKIVPDYPFEKTQLELFPAISQPS